MLRVHARPIAATSTQQIGCSVRLQATQWQACTPRRCAPSAAAGGLLYPAHIVPVLISFHVMLWQAGSPCPCAPSAAADRCPAAGRRCRRRCARPAGQAQRRTDRRQGRHTARCTLEMWAMRAVAVALMQGRHGRLIDAPQLWAALPAATRATCRAGACARASRACYAVRHAAGLCCSAPSM